MYIAILGRQPALGMAELERLYGADAVRWFSGNTATIDDKNFVFNDLGGSQKAGRVVKMFDRGDWRVLNNFIIQEYAARWRDTDHKITLGVSVYDVPTSSREIQRTGLALKKQLKSAGTSLRLIPNSDPVLNTATSHHNKLGLSEYKVELLIVKGASGKIILAESIGAQNITAIAARDQARPKTDAYVGMLPPKLARMMVNMTRGRSALSGIWDPFCGTGVILQEASLLDIPNYGSDLSEKMVEYSRTNLDWLRERFSRNDTTWFETEVSQGDATSFTAPSTWKFDAITSESYLGQPFSAFPAADKLEQVKSTCNSIISEALKNLHRQLPPDATLCLAIPAWHRPDGHFVHLPLTQHLRELGYERIDLTHVRHDQLLYYRESQVVARELLLLRREL